ncbi:hypothetical protein [Winogradskyella arenosi]|uniref:PH (Pleckstrin Homology) domain-containing protein n=1 Tax=Winogradskyella arenosi TaxID=533325 RepID=A0A368ZFB3_9FLAO|nr:hypothetical protein [Winogradskyella arenosi]RCW91596.1 hypothetical protein DFQ08_103426 [Winogradskyella arenosi]
MRIFKEEQRFNQTWLIVLMLISSLVPLALFINDYLKNPETYSVTELLLLLSILIFVGCFIFFIKLSTKIDQHGIHYKFFPIHRSFKIIPWTAIERIHVKTYDPISDYGGWGFKGGALWNRSKGQSITVSGDIGIQIILKNGKKLLIGTQQPQAAERSIAYYKSKYKQL